MTTEFNLANKSIATFITNLANFILVIFCLASCSGDEPRRSTTNASTGEKTSRAENPDLLIYGATPGGIAAATAASRHGSKVTIIEPSKRVGGIVAAGLTASDVCIHKLIGGISREYFERVGEQYGEKISWRHEPHVAEEEFEKLILGEKISLFLNTKLDSAEIQNSKVVSVKTKNGRRFSASNFIDASYEGDLMALAKVSFSIGREARSKYNENFAGRSPYDDKNQFPKEIDPYGSEGNLLPEISSGSLAPEGSGDNMTMAYNFRPCFSKDPENQVKFKKPTNYDPGRYELLARYVELERHTIKLSELLLFLTTVQNKADINSIGPFSTDMLNNSSSWAESDWNQREEIFQRHKLYTQGLLYFLSTSPRIPERIQKDLNKWGLCKDEFVETDNWPHRLYVRSGRRMIGEYVLTEHDLLKNNFKPDSIGWGTCRIELHHTQRVLDNKRVINEGRVGYRNKPYQIPYRSITPKKEEITNLLVPVSLSASNVAYSSVRMEPVFMILGHAAGVAAHLAQRDKVPVQDINLAELQRILLDEKSVL